MSETRSGGCLCGAVRYEADWPPVATVICHCKNCQKQSGSALSVVAVLPRNGLRVTGALAVFEDKAESGRPVWRKFCNSCGSPLVTDTPGAQADNMIFLKAGSLDKTDDLNPSIHYWQSSAQGWFAFPEDVTCLEKQ